jgi:phosphoglycolate phosphatase-like HAD superfamily hydrolase
MIRFNGTMESIEKRAVIFDLDGTLIDSDPDIRAAISRVVAAEGLAPLSTAEVQSMIGDGAKVLLERAFAARGSQAEPPASRCFSGRLRGKFRRGNSALLRYRCGA